MSRFSLDLPDELMRKVKEVAAERESSANEVLRQFVKLGLLVAELEKNPNSKLIIREGKKESVVILM